MRAEVFNKQKGFTLIELLVVVVIMGVLTTGIVLNVNLGREDSVLDNTARRLVSRAREVQLMSMSAQRLNNDVPCGYGMHYYDEDTIYLFSEDRADCDNAQRVYPAGGGASFSVTKVDLQEPNIVKLTDSSRFKDVFFEPPDGLVYIDGTRSAGASSTITVCLRSGCANRRMKVRVSGGGVVEVID